MPTYELKCKDCGQAFELFVQRLLRDTDKVCPACGSREVATGIGGGSFLRPQQSPQGGCASRGGFG